MIRLSQIQRNPNNPRVIRDARFAALKESIKGFPQMMEAREIVVDETWIVLGGNMRLRAIRDLGYTEIADNWVKQVLGWTPEQKREFTAKDNANYGEWDWEKLANEWTEEPLADWGIEIPLVASDEETIRTDDSAGTARVESLKFRSYQIVMTEDEADAFEAHIIAYLDQHNALPGLMGELLAGKT